MAPVSTLCAWTAGLSLPALGNAAAPGQLPVTDKVATAQPGGARAGSDFSGSCFCPFAPPCQPFHQIDRPRAQARGATQGTPCASSCHRAHTEHIQPCSICRDQPPARASHWPAARRTPPARSSRQLVTSPFCPWQARLPDRSSKLALRLQFPGSNAVCPCLDCRGSQRVVLGSGSAGGTVPVQPGSLPPASPQNRSPSMQLVHVLW